MKVYRSLKEFKKLDHAVVTSGTFDGLHLGHQKIINRLKEVCKNVKGESLVLTFWPHPRTIVSKDQKKIQLLSTIEEKIELFKDYSIDHLLIVPFTREFSELSAKEYQDQILLEKIGTKTMVIGYDHKFGKNREGSFQFLKDNEVESGLTIFEIPKQEVIDLTVSSTKIRDYLSQGNVELAAKLLGRNYSFTGIVKKGRQLGRTIGYPTANVSIGSELKLIPQKGVYGVLVTIRQKQLLGIMNIGNRPTVNGTGQSQEVHIFDFNEDIYGETIKVDILYFIREEHKFESIENLVSQIEKDSEIVKNKFHEK